MADEKNEFYANSVSITTSLYDVTLTFKTESIVADKEGKPMGPIPVATFNVRMSPQQAKALASILIKHITDYEKDHHVTLPIPENIENWWKTFIKPDPSNKILH